MGAIKYSEMQVPVRLRSGQAFDSDEVRFAQDDRSFLLELVSKIRFVSGHDFSRAEEGRNNIGF
jgi:hypothetical protein